MNDQIEHSNQGNEPADGSAGPFDYTYVQTVARIAQYDDLRSAPRITEIQPAPTADFIEHLASKIYEQAKMAGGTIPYTVIREVSENFIHARFAEIIVSILDEGNTIPFIARYRKEAGRCIVTFQSAVESFHYVTDEANVVVRGSDHTLEQSRYNTDLVYIQNRALAKDAADNAIGITCPNCGAPVTNLGAKFCEYCGAGIIELNVHAWSFENIEEA